METTQQKIVAIRAPLKSDGVAVNQLVEQCPPLDKNSLYCNLLVCTHFTSTSAVAESEGRLVGYVSGYILPDDERTLFIWQVAVHPIARGGGIAKKMVMNILERSKCEKVEYLKTTITADNQVSMSLFRSISTSLKAKITKEEYFDRDRDLGGKHDSEWMVQLGPFKSSVSPMITDQV